MLIPQVNYGYHYEQYNTTLGIKAPDRPEDESEYEDEDELAGSHSKRDRRLSKFWELSQVSTPKGADWFGDENFRDTENPTATEFYHYYHSSAGEGQYIYIVEDDIVQTHDEFKNTKIERLQGAGDYGDPFLTTNEAMVDHGTW